MRLIMAALGSRNRTASAVVSQRTSTPCAAQRPQHQPRDVKRQIGGPLVPRGTAIEAKRPHIRLNASNPALSGLSNQEPAP